MLLVSMLCLLPLRTEGVEVIDTQVIGNSLSSCPSDEKREDAKIDARNVINDIKSYCTRVWRRSVASSGLS